MKRVFCKNPKQPSEPPTYSIMLPPGVVDGLWSLPKFRDDSVPSWREYLALVGRVKRVD